MLQPGDVKRRDAVLGPSLAAQLVALMGGTVAVLGAALLGGVVAWLVADSKNRRERVALAREMTRQVRARYEAYVANVPAFFPRLTPWRGEA